MEFTAGEKLLGGVIGGIINKRKSSKAAKKAEQKREKLLETTDWDPAVYASEIAPTYQKTKSPAAQAYFESMMNGSNPLLTPRNRTNAAAIQAGQQRKMDDLYGTQAEIAQAQAAAREETPWKVDPSGLPMSSDFADKGEEDAELEKKRAAQQALIAKLQAAGRKNGVAGFR